MDLFRGTKAWSAVLTLTLSLCVVILTPLAYAIPPDPSWVSAVCDAADYDEVAILITSALDAIQPVELIDVGLNQQATSLARSLRAHVVVAFVRSSHSRAPPHR